MGASYCCNFLTIAYGSISNYRSHNLNSYPCLLIYALLACVTLCSTSGYSKRLLTEPKFDIYKWRVVVINFRNIKKCRAENRSIEY